MMGTSAFGEGIDENTVLLLHFNGEDGSTNIVDDSNSNNSITGYGNAQLDIAEKKFSSTSLFLDGIAGYISVPDSGDWYLGTGPFTVDFWVKFNAITNHVMLVEQFEVINGRPSMWYLFYNNTDKTLVMSNMVDGLFNLQYKTSFNPQTGVWYHLAMVRKGLTDSDWYIFVNGISQPLTKTEGEWNGDMPDINYALYIGARGYPGYENYYLNGWLDEFRISKGIARWTSNFTPPTSEYDGIPNELPTADAGDDLTANVGEELTLNGSMSSDPDGSIVFWVWRSLSDPQKPIIAEGEYATVKAHGYAQELVELTVTDNKGGSATDTMKIINPGIQGPQGPPGMTPEEIATMENQIITLQQQNTALQQQAASLQQENAQQQQKLSEDRYLLEQLPQLKKKIAELEAQQTQ